MWTFEGTAGYTFQPIGLFTPTLSGTFGYQVTESDKAAEPSNDGQWRRRLPLLEPRPGSGGRQVHDRLRYWDTNISDSPATATGKDFCDGIPGKNGSVRQSTSASCLGQGYAAIKSANTTSTKCAGLLARRFSFLRLT